MKENQRKDVCIFEQDFILGLVIGTVVGARNPKYSLIGDTVNTASRMRSNSLPD
jgi:class 3 adenylate cyclase